MYVLSHRQASLDPIRGPMSRKAVPFLNRVGASSAREHRCTRGVHPPCDEIKACCMGTLPDKTVGEYTCGAYDKEPKHQLPRKKTILFCSARVGACRQSPTSIGACPLRAVYAGRGAEIALPFFVVRGDCPPCATPCFPREMYRRATKRTKFSITSYLLHVPPKHQSQEARRSEKRWLEGVVHTHGRFEDTVMPGQNEGFPVDTKLVSRSMLWFGYPLLCPKTLASS